MKIAVIQFLFFVVCVGTLLAADESLSLTGEETAKIKQRLAAYEKGQITWDDLTESPESSLKLIKYYLSHTNEVTTKMKLPISRSFILLGKAPEAVTLAEEYVGVYSNDWRGWRVLGGAKLMMKSYDEAIPALTNAAKLGDDKNYAGLGAAALGANRPDIFESMVAPHLLIMMNDTNGFQNSERFKMRCMLILYALNEEKKGIFVKAIDGLTTNVILSDEDLKNKVAYGCEIFKGRDIDEIRKKLAVATENNSILSNTNSP